MGWSVGFVLRPSTLANMKDNIKFSDCLQWRTVQDGFVCYVCGKTYIGKQRGLAYCGEMACKKCAQGYGFVSISIQTLEVI